ncbi:MAG: V-type ATP synthase subunit D [Kiritimatiellae bacterium]|nr:V-type ATP synthase subunit D [Kiritimatiellia bacterium]
MARVKLTKTELKAQSDALKRFLRFLPMLQLKKQQLQAEIALIVSKAEAVAAKEAACRDALSGWISLLATDAPAFEKLVRVRETKTSTSNIAGVSIPVFESLDLAVEPVDAWESPAWIDDAVASEKELLALRAERAVCEEQRRLVEEELRQTSQRVNLFEKVKIPECREAIRVIKIALGDEQTAAVTRGKIAKSRAPAADGRAE